MSGSLVGQAGGFSFEIANGVIPREGPRAIPVLAQFSAAATSILDLTLVVQQAKISAIQGFWVDNSANTAAITFTVQATQQTMTIPAGAQGYVPVLAGVLPRFTAVSSGGVDVRFLFLNVPVPALVWQGSAAYTIGTVNQGAPNAGGANAWPVRPQVANADVSAANPLPVTSGVSGLTITQTQVVLAPATSALIIAANANRKYLAIQVVNTNPATVSSVTPAVVNVGLNLNGAPAVGWGGGLLEYNGNRMPLGALYGISTLGTTVNIWEGV